LLDRPSSAEHLRAWLPPAFRVALCLSVLAFTLRAENVVDFSKIAVALTATQT
jgi:hypothetical protein